MVMLYPYRLPWYVHPAHALGQQSPSAMQTTNAPTPRGMLMPGIVTPDSQRGNSEAQRQARNNGKRWAGSLPAQELCVVEPALRLCRAGTARLLQLDAADVEREQEGARDGRGQDFNESISDYTYSAPVVASTW